MLAALAVPGTADAARCKADGKRCRTNGRCCGGVCINTAPSGKKPSGRCCTPTTCAAAGAECGLLGDGTCPDTLYCGACAEPEVCGGGGTPNICATPTTSTTVSTPSTTSTMPAPGTGGVLVDPKAELGTLFAFRGYEPGSTPTVAVILTVDAFQEPAMGAGSSLFDPELLYAIRIDNDHDARADIVFEFRFATEVVSPDVLTGLLGIGASGAPAPANSPPPIAPGAVVVPPRIGAPDDAGVALRQTYRVTRIDGETTTELSAGQTLFASPANAGPRTLDSAALFAAAVRTLPEGIRVFAGSVDEPSWGDRGGALDTFNTAKSPPILSPAEDASLVNLSSDASSGFTVNAIALELPVSLLTRTKAIEPASSPAATIGVWATTSRPRTRTLPTQPGGTPTLSTDHVQVARRGNPLVAELLIGVGSRRRFGMDAPVNDVQFIGSFQDPVLARVLNALFGGAMAIPSPPRTDLLSLLTYAPPVAAAGTPPGPIADILRLNTGVAATPPGGMNRLGLLAGDPAGFPNGCRPVDDPVDVMWRLVAGGVLAGPPFDTSPVNARLGDGVNVNDVASPPTFPYLAPPHGGRVRRHIDPGEAGCTAGGGGACLP
jgi:hypothetical protein